MQVTPASWPQKRNRSPLLHLTCSTSSIFAAPLEPILVLSLKHLTSFSARKQNIFHQLLWCGSTWSFCVWCDESNRGNAAASFCMLEAEIWPWIFLEWPNVMIAGFSGFHTYPTTMSSGWGCKVNSVPSFSWTRGEGGGWRRKTPNHPDVSWFMHSIRKLRHLENWSYLSVRVIIVWYK